MFIYYIIHQLGMVTKMDSQKKKKKTLKIEQDIHKELSDMGGKGDTFSMIIRRLIAQNKLLSESLGEKKVEQIKLKDLAKWEGKI